MISKHKNPIDQKAKKKNPFKKRILASFQEAHTTQLLVVMEKLFCDLSTILIWKFWKDQRSETTEYFF